MNPAAEIPISILIQGLLTIVAFIAVVGALALSIREASGGYWIFGWAALLLTGAFYLLVEAGYALALRPAFVADAVFAPLIYMGALEYAGRRAPLRLLAVGVAVGLLRVALDAADLSISVALLGALYGPGFLLASAWAVRSAPPASPLRTPMVILLLAWFGVELFDAWLDWYSGEQQVPWRLVIGVCTPLAALQVASRFISIQSGFDSVQRASDRAEQQRDLERWRFHTVFDHVHELIAELAPDTRILFVNERARDLLGLDPAALIGQRAIDFVPAELRDEAAELWRLQIKGVHARTTFPFVDKDGQPIQLEIAVSDYGFSDEQRLLVIARDTTGRQAVEQALERDRQELERRVAERTEQLRASMQRLREQERLAGIGTLAAGIAHQINNPVGAIAVTGEFALAAGVGEGRERVREEAIVRMVEEAHRAGRIVKSILRFARQGSTQKWREDFVAVVRRAVELARPYVGERNGRIEIEVGVEVAHVEMSPIEIEQLVINLVRNAAESRTSGACVRIRLGVVGGLVRLEIEDDGRGIDPESQKQIFDPFFTTRLREGGSGLGLSVAHGIVVDHGGEITVESQPGQGTTVRVDFPLA
jgi:PAS domain S-box-containing protein